MLPDYLMKEIKWQGNLEMPQSNQNRDLYPNFEIR